MLDPQRILLYRQIEIVYTELYRQIEIVYIEVYRNSILPVEYENWTENPRIITARCFGTVFYCKAQLGEDTGGVRQFVRIQIGGQSFMMQ